MVAIVTLIFSLCWLPLTLFILSANLFEEKTAILYYFKVIANSFAYMNSAVNPIIYAFHNRSFRTNCGNIFKKPVCCSLFCKFNHTIDETQSPRQVENGLGAKKYQLVHVNPMIIDEKHGASIRAMTSGDFSDDEDDPEKNPNEHLLTTTL